MFDNLDLMLEKVFKFSGLGTMIFTPAGILTGENISISLAIIASLIAIFSGITREFRRRKEHKRNMEIMDLEMKHILKELKKVDDESN